MANDLKMEVILQAIDRATRPIRAVSQSSIGLAASLKDSRAQLKQLQNTQNDVSSFKRLHSISSNTAQALQAQRDKVKALSRDIAASEHPTKQMVSAQREAIRAAGELKRNHQQQQRELNTLRQRLGAAGISTKQLGQHERDLRNRIEATNSQINAQKQRMKALTAQQKRLTAAKSQYEKTQGLASSMAGSGAAGLASGSGMLYAGARMLAPGVQFDEDMAKVQALTRLDKNSAELAELRKQARQLGADTMFSATDAAQGQGFLAMAGFTPQAIKAAMPAMLDVAKAGGVELGETADIASNILTGMRLQAGQMGQVGDVLVATFTRSNTSVQMLGETMKYVAPVAASLGQDFETVSAMAGKLGDAGIQGGMAGTALRSILNRLSAPPKMAADALDKLGISAKDSAGNMRQMPELLSEIYEKTKDLGTADRAGILKSIAGEEAVSALQVLVRQAGSGELQEFIGTLRAAQGEAAKTAKVMGDNLVGDLDELSSAWEDLGIELQEQQNGPLREITQTLADLVGGIKNWIVENPELAATIVKVAAGVAILMAAGGGLALMLASILGPIAMLRYAMILFTLKGAGLASVLWNLGKSVLPVVGKGLWALGATTLTLASKAAIALTTALFTLAKVALPLVAKGILLIGRALLMTPIGLAITAIAGAAYLIYENWDGIKAFFSGIWDGIKAGADQGVLGLAAAVLNITPLAWFYKAFASVMSWFGVELPNTFTGYGSMLIDGLITGIKNKWNAAKETFTDLGDSAASWFKEKLGIHSPSRVFAQLGGHTMAGLEQGLNDNQNGPLRSITDLAKQLTAAGAITLGAAGSALAMDTRAPLSANTQRAQPVVQGDTYHITIQASAGTDIAGLEQMLTQLLDKRERNKAARVRSALHDQE